MTSLTAKEWGLSAVAGCLAALAAAFSTENPVLALASFTAFFALGLALFRLYPAYAERKRSARLEKQLPFVLMQLSTELALGQPFEQALAGLEKGFGELSQEFKLVSREIDQAGASVQEALLHLSERARSRELRRGLSQVINVYEQGSPGRRPGEALRRLARDLLLKQKAEVKEFSGKQVMASLLFISVAAIAPALFMAFVSIGSLFLEVGLTSWQVIAIACLGFPLADLAVIGLIKEKTPECLKT